MEQAQKKNSIIDVSEFLVNKAHNIRHYLDVKTFARKSDKYNSLFI